MMKKNKNFKIINIVLGILFVLLLVLIAICIYFLSPVGGDGEDVEFVVLEGSSLSEIGNNLEEMNLWSTFIYIDDRIGDTTYIGRVYQMRDNKQNYMDKVNPVKMELTTTITGDQMNAMITVLEGELEGAGLLIDKINKTIYNGDNPNLQDIYEYEILLEKRKKY